MRLFSLAFLFGVIFLQFFSGLPDLKWSMSITIISFLSIFFFKKNFRLIPAFLLGFSWALFYANVNLSQKLSSDIEGKPLPISGFIASIPDEKTDRTSFLFSTKNGIVRLSWQKNYPTLSVGDEWRLLVKLKKIHGTLNPGGSDFEAWAMEEGVGASGYVIDSADNRLLSSRWYHRPLDRIREFLFNKIRSTLKESPTSHWIPALAVGERQGIGADSWDILRKTGTNHLMAIAGLHIGLMAAFSYSIVFFFWRRFPKLVLKLPAQHAGAIASLFVGILYSALAGFSIPTQRACLMLTVFLLMTLLRRNIASWQAFSIALVGVLLMNPLSVLSDSFFLSFFSVALIIFGVSGRLAPSGVWWKWGRIQWVLTIGLVPLSILLFQQCSLVSFIANTIAIPWVGFFVVPLTLLGSVFLLFSAKLGGFFLLFADKLLSLLWKILTVLSALSWSTWYHSVSHAWIFFASCLGIILLLMPAGISGRLFAIIFLSPLFIFKTPTPNPGEIWFTLLDVGQGLSAVVQTQKHLLVFDAGAKWNDNFDLGKNVVLPFLRTLNSKNIDVLVISHGDNDHIGGAKALYDEIPIASIKTSAPEKLPYKEVSYCLRGEAWEWDGVYFKFEYPTQDTLHLNNNSSCVLRISNKNKTILLTGDIEKAAENDLVNLDGKNLSADILIAPHHGSKTSAEDEFIDAINPRVVLFSAGYRNQYHFPHPSVVKKYHDRGVLLFDTVHAGAIQFDLTQASDSLAPVLYRKKYKRYWRED